MKPFNLKDPKTQRWFLFSTLVIALGFNLSWNPENTHIARYEYGHGYPGQTELASSDAKPSVNTEAVAGNIVGAEVKGAKDETSAISNDSVDLGKLSSRLTGVRARYAIDKSDGTIVFHMDTDRKDVCSKCFETSETVSVGKENLENLPLIGEKILAVALSKLGTSKKSLVDSKDEDKVGRHSKKDKESKDIEVTSVCKLHARKGESEDVLTCQKGEFDAIMDQCDKMKTEKETTACERKANNYFAKYLGKTIKNGLAADPKSDAFTDAVAARDELLADFDGDTDSKIAKTLVGITAAGVYQRGSNFFRQQMQMPGATAFNANESAKRFINQDVMRVGLPLQSALNDNNLMSLYQSSFVDPLGKIVNGPASQNSIFSAQTDAMFQEIAAMGTVNPVPEGIYDVRAQYGQGSSATAFGYARPGGRPAQLAPGANLQSQQQFGPGQQQFGPNQFPNQPNQQQVPGGINQNNPAPNQFRNSVQPQFQ